MPREDEGDLQGKVALVLGGTGLIGAQVCRVLAKRGAAVAIHHFRGMAAPLQAELGDCSVSLDLHVDATEPGSGEQAVRTVGAELGPPEIVVNSYHPHFEPVAIVDASFERDWIAHIASLRFYVEVTTAVLPDMRHAGFGRFVLVSGALSARPLPGCSAYGTVKAGLHSFQRHLALEEGCNGITANTVAPGRVAPGVSTTSTAWGEANAAATVRAALPRDPEAIEVAEIVAYLCGPGASSITGQVVYLARGGHGRMREESGYESLVGRVCVVTGGAERVGRIIALRFAAEGADVVINHLDREEQALKTAAEIERLGRRCAIVEVDVADTSAGDSIIETAERSFGRIDVLIHNASNFISEAFGKVTPGKFDESLGVNLRGPFFVSQAVGNYMLSQGWGKIIAIAGNSLYETWPNHAAHTLAKSALARMMDLFAIGLSPTVQCNVVAPDRILPSADEQDRNVMLQRGEVPREPGGLARERPRPLCSDNLTRATWHRCSCLSLSHRTASPERWFGSMAAGRFSNHGTSGAVDGKGTNVTLSRGLDILELLATADSTMSVEEIKAGTGLPGSSTYRLLRSLVDRGWVTPAADGRYGPGLRFMGLAESLRLDHWIAPITHGVLEQLAAAYRRDRSADCHLRSFRTLRCKGRRFSPRACDPRAREASSAACRCVVPDPARLCVKGADRCRP